MSGPGGIGTNGVFPTLSTTAAGVKRSREDDDGSTADPSSSTPSISQTAAAAAAAQTAAKRRKRSASTTIPTELGEEDRLLLRLKDEENLPWKDIAARFQTDLGKTYQVPALQMRFKRLRERLRVWTDDDVAALRHAHEYWEKNKFEIISAKVSLQMTEYGASDKWSARHCHRKWQEMNPGVDPYATQLQISTAAAQAAAQATPAFTNMSSTSSPTDAQPIFSFYHASTTA
ncbi:hypothetical protein BDY21DRAFT_284661 [Lineolata rhizophorae]|uniref:Myb-like domain-containing protein n=1 Tax=Lineolata rhizophorae TaxID=578093 RepID=A0A6A6P3P6_9PEZI|nr:hypothetical protein BDY21DRAFT_284661 [Lineolata rhizophorae]